MNTPALLFSALFLRIGRILLLAPLWSGTAASAAMAVDTNLGTLGFESVALTGTSSGRPNNANYYSNTSGQEYWGSEYVYRFTINVRSEIFLDSDDTNGDVDNDFFLLSERDTTVSGTNHVGTAVGRRVSSSGVFGIFEPGTYYLSVDAYAEIADTATGKAGPFNAVLTVARVEPPASRTCVGGGTLTTTLGPRWVLWFSFGHSGGSLAVDTVGSSLSPYNDTELFLFSATGNLIDFNDDFIPDNFLSQISLPSLAEGTYYLAACGYDSEGSNGFNVSSASSETGQLVINGLALQPAIPPFATEVVPGGAISANLAAREVLWFYFAHPGGDFTVDTMGSNLAPTNDTELFLLEANGNVIAAEDDMDENNFLSRISSPALAAGSYYLAVSAFDADGSDGFFITSTSGHIGEVVLNGLSVGSASKLAAVSLVGNTQTLRLTGTPGKTYLIEKSPSLAPDSWLQDGPPVTLTSGEQIVTRSIGSSDSRLFYRAREQ